MKASELRIGNYISIEYMNHEEETILEQCDVVCISGTGELTLDSLHDDDQVFTHLEDCKPIPLTEEWLLKFGLNSGFLHFDSPKLTISVNLDAKNGGYNELQVATSGTSDLIIECNYVHQLQNLYFALTGQELTI